jgi:hypothetical protein
MNNKEPKQPIGFETLQKEKIRILLEHAEQNHTKDNALKISDSASEIHHSLDESDTDAMKKQAISIVRRALREISKHDFQENYHEFKDIHIIKGIEGQQFNEAIGNKRKGVYKLMEMISDIIKKLSDNKHNIKISTPYSFSSSDDPCKEDLRISFSVYLKAGKIDMNDIDPILDEIEESLVYSDF